MKKFLAHFFGAGAKPEYANFTLAHFAPILLLVCVIVLIWRNRDRLRGWKHEEAIRYFLAFALIITDMSYYWRYTAMPSLGGNLVENLPIGVCCWAVIFCSYMVIGKSQTLFDICYFWLFSGSLFALITPTALTYTGPTRYRYYQFWLEHTLGYISLFYMIFVHGMRPYPKSAVKSYVALAIMAVIAYNVNTMIGPGANYLFMAKPESTPSVLDILPPNFVLRLIIMAAVVTIMFGLAYLPWYRMDQKKKSA